MSKPNPQPFEIRIREIRREAHITQAVAAEILGVSKDTIGRWERGQTVPSTPQAIISALIAATR